MKDQTQRIVATGLVASVLGVFFYVQYNKEKEIKLVRLDLETLKRSSPYSLQDLESAKRYSTVWTHSESMPGGSPENPLMLVWNPEDAARITVNSSTGELFVDDVPVLKWDKDRAFVFGTSEQSPENWARAVPLSQAAALTHPLHKLHRYEKLEDYRWLEAFYPKGSAPELTPPAEKYRYPDANANNFKKEWKRIYNLRQESVEYRQWALDHSLRSLRVILDSRHHQVTQELGFSNDSYVMLLAAMARMESGEGAIPGPSLNVVNRSRHHGWGQFYVPGLTASPLLKPSEADATKMVWAGLEVNGRGINSWQDFLASPDAQLLAIDALVLDNYRSLKPHIDRGYDLSGSLMAAHLLGAGAVKGLFNRYTPEQMADPEMLKEKDLKADGNGTTAVAYYQLFSGYLSQEKAPRRGSGVAK